MTEATQKQVTSLKVYPKDLKWLKKQKLEKNHDTLADTFSEVRTQLE